MVEVDMREHGHLHHLREPAKVCRAEVQVLHIHRSGDPEDLSDVDLGRQADGAHPVHDLRVLQLGVVLSIQRPEAAVQQARVYVVLIIQTLRLVRLALPSPPRLARPLLQTLLNTPEGGLIALALSSGHPVQHGAVAFSHEVLNAVHQRYHGQPELRGEGARLKETPRGIQLGLDCRCNTLPLHRLGRRERAGIADRGLLKHAAIGRQVLRHAPRARAVGRTSLPQVARDHDVHVAVWYLGVEVQYAREEVRVALGHRGQQRLAPARPPRHLREGAKKHRGATGAARRAGGAASARLEKLQVHPVDLLQRAAQPGRGGPLAEHLPDVVHEV
mmetsp:Transcript_112842/g.306381  ORF Transcript_112842/g.306381 Transcript_112842/m.306381 type:complete len:331 (-) Transcript_112842:790-1782(-)